MWSGIWDPGYGFAHTHQPTGFKKHVFFGKRVSAGNRCEQKVLWTKTCSKSDARDTSDAERKCDAWNPSVNILCALTKETCHQDALTPHHRQVRLRQAVRAAKHQVCRCIASVCRRPYFASMVALGIVMHPIVDCPMSSMILWYLHLDVELVSKNFPSSY